MDDQLLEQQARRRSRAYDQCQHELECLILATPTSNVRNKLTDIRNDLAELEDELKGVIKRG
jgi:uncharacterized membrane protein